MIINQDIDPQLSHHALRAHLPHAAAAMRIPLAGGVDETIMSEVSAVILPFFTMAEAAALRLVCREFLEAVRDYQWEDGETVIRGSIGAWRRSFPRARCAVTDAAFVHLRGIQLLSMGECWQFTDAAFVHLRGIHTLYMRWCNQPAISDAAFAHLRGIHTLVMDNCDQATITGASFAHLQGIQALGMNDCRADLVATARSLGLRVNTRHCLKQGPFHCTFDDRGWE